MEFWGKTWIYTAQAMLFAPMIALCLILGPLFFFEVAKNAHGRPARDAGIALIAIGLGMLPLLALALFKIASRRRPLIQVGPEGLVVRIIGVSSLDQYFLIPGLIRLAWHVISFEGFRQQEFFMPWKLFNVAEVSGVRMIQHLTLRGGAVDLRSMNLEKPRATTKIVLPDSWFKASLDEIADSINAYHDVALGAAQLPDPNPSRDS